MLLFFAFSFSHTFFPHLSFHVASVIGSYDFEAMIGINGTKKSQKSIEMIVWLNYNFKCILRLHFN